MDGKKEWWVEYDNGTEQGGLLKVVTIGNKVKTQEENRTGKEGKGRVIC